MLQVGLALVYPALAIVIWFLPALQKMSILNKIIISTLLFLYGVFRIYRFLKKPAHEEEE